jgi:hypothetical protein
LRFRLFDRVTANVAPRPTAAAPAASNGVFAFFATSATPSAAVCAVDVTASRADPTAPAAAFAARALDRECPELFDARALVARELDDRFAVVVLPPDRPFAARPFERPVEVLRRWADVRVFVSAIRSSLSE